jgi:PAS domain S-box-containing protein
VPATKHLFTSVKFLDSLGLLVYSWDPTGDRPQAAFHSRSFVNLTGYPLPRFKDRTFWSSIVHEEDQELFSRMMEQLKRGTPCSEHYRVIHKGGGVLWVSDRARPILRRGKVVRVEGLVRDISERMQIQEALREAEARFRIALKNSPIAVFNQDKDLRYTFLYNAQLVLDAEATIGGNDFDIFPYEDAVCSTAIKQRILDSEALVRDEFKVTQNGITTYLDLTGEPLRDANGQIVGITCATMDITDRRVAEEKLRESESRFRSIFENAAVGVALVDRRGKVITANDAYCRFLGCLRDDLALEEYPEYACPDESYVTEVLAGGTTDGYGIERRHIRRDGEAVWGRINLSVVRDSCGIPQYTVVVCEDVTKRKQAEEALQANQRLLQRITDSTPTLIYIFDIVKHQNIFLNKSASAFLGCSHNPNRSVLEKIHPDDLSVWEGVRTRLAEADDEDLLEATFRLKSRQRNWRTLRTWSMVFSRDPDGSAREILSCAMDITEHQEALREIQLYHGQLLSLASEISLAQEHERRQIAVALHDQIGQLLAMARMKLRASLKPIHEGQLRENLSQVTALIEETLKETRSLTFELSPPILAELGFEAAVSWLAKHMGERFGLRVELRKSKTELSLSPEMAAVLYQAVRELLMNVIKHAQVDSARVSIREQDQKVYVSVRDRGAGFDPGVIENPVRMDGFGLFSIRERLRYFGGRVSVESKPERGTVVTLVAPTGPLTAGRLDGPQASKGGL